MSNRPDFDALHWLRQLREGEPDATRVIWDHFFPRVARFARSRLSDIQLRKVDHEDIALAVLHDLFSGLSSGRFEDLADRDELWALLARMTIRRIIDARRSNKNEPVQFGDASTSSDQVRASLELAASGDPGPQEMAELRDLLTTLMQRLGERDRGVAILRLGGHSISEIAARLQCSPSTIDRTMAHVRRELAALYIDKTSLDEEI